MNRTIPTENKTFLIRVIWYFALLKATKMTGQCKKILIADDDPEDQEMLMDVITRMDKDLQIDTVANGGQLLDYLSASQPADLPSLIILDYKMPVLNAAEALERLKTDQHFVHIPKVVWSTSRREDDIRRCIDAGAKRYFIKPAQLSELKQIAGQMLEYCS
jgi:CheY-like chemotaxis protein